MNKTILVIGIIALFIGLAFIPIFNAIPLSTSDDNIPQPIIDVTWEIYKLDNTWYVDFNCSFDDNGSGIHRVAWYLNGLEQDTISGPGPFAFYITLKLSIVKKCVLTFVAYYGIGLSAFIEIDGSDIKSEEDCIECQLSNNPFCTFLNDTMWFFCELMIYYLDKADEETNPILYKIYRNIGLGYYALSWRTYYLYILYCY